MRFTALVQAGHEEVHPDHEQNDRHNPTGELEAQERLLYEAHACLRHGESRPGGNNERKHCEYGGKDDLTEELASHCEALVLLLAYLGEIVDEAEDTHRHHGEQCEDGRPSRPCPVVQKRYRAEAHQPSTTASTMTTPPSVGVPRLT